LDVSALLGLLDLAILPAFVVVIVPVVALLISLVAMVMFISIFDFGAELYRNQINIHLGKGSR
jgi:hypothetical protein